MQARLLPFGRYLGDDVRVLPLQPRALGAQLVQTHPPHPCVRAQHAERTTVFDEPCLEHAALHLQFTHIAPRGPQLLLHLRVFLGAPVALATQPRQSLGAFQNAFFHVLAAAVRIQSAPSHMPSRVTTLSPANSNARCASASGRSSAVYTPSSNPPRARTQRT